MQRTPYFLAGSFRGGSVKKSCWLVCVREKYYFDCKFTIVYDNQQHAKRNGHAREVTTWEAPPDDCDEGDAQLTIPCPESVDCSGTGTELRAALCSDQDQKKTPHLGFRELPTKTKNHPFARRVS